MWPFGIALRRVVSNRLMLRWLKTVVVSDEEKAHVMRQVGARKTIIVEVSKSRQTASKPRCSIDLGMSLADVR